MRYSRTPRSDDLVGMERLRSHIVGLYEAAVAARALAPSKETLAPCPACHLTTPALTRARVPPAELRQSSRGAIGALYTRDVAAEAVVVADRAEAVVVADRHVPDRRSGYGSLGAVETYCGRVPSYRSSVSMRLSLKRPVGRL